jgi:hypothetical protein
MAEEFAGGLIESHDPGLEKRIDGELLVIGRVSAHGQFLPDWQ